MLCIDAERERGLFTNGAVLVSMGVAPPANRRSRPRAVVITPLYFCRQRLRFFILEVRVRGSLPNSRSTS